MSKIVVYGSKLCPDTVEALDALKKNNVAHTYLDITDDLSNLKAFLKYRDTRGEYESVRQKGGIGIPFFVIDDGASFTFDYKELI